MLGLLLILIFLRPFISSLAFPEVNFWYLSVFFVIIIAWFIHKKPPINCFAKIKLPLFIFIFALFYSSLLSPFRPAALIQLFQYTGGLALFLVCACLSQEDKQEVAYSLLVCGILVACLAIRQYLFGFNALQDFAAKKGLTDQFLADCLLSRRVFMPFTTPNMLAGYLAMLIGLSLAARYRILFILFFLPALLLTRSLGGILSVFCGLLIYALLRKWSWKRFFALSMLFTVIITVMLYLRLNTGKEHLHFDFSVFMRLDYWKDTFGMVLAHPLTGVGLGNFNLTYSRYAHNILLQLWAETGIVGLISFLWLVVAVFFAGLRSKINLNWKPALAAASLIFLLHNLVDFSFFLPETAFIWWVILGLFYQPE